MDPKILGGVPVFSGTRLPIESVLGAIDAGVTLEELKNMYPHLTQGHIDAARAFGKMQPRP